MGNLDLDGVALETGSRKPSRMVHFICFFDPGPCAS